MLTAAGARPFGQEAFALCARKGAAVFRLGNKIDFGSGSRISRDQSHCPAAVSVFRLHPRSDQRLSADPESPSRTHSPISERKGRSQLLLGSASIRNVCTSN